MALNKVYLCGVNTSKLPVLSEEEKKRLFDRIEEGDARARQQFIEGNLRLVLIQEKIPMICFRLDV